MAEFFVAFRTRVREEDEAMNVLALKSVIDHHMANLLPTASHRLISQGEEMSDHRSILDYALHHGLILEENSGILYHPESPIENRLRNLQAAADYYVGTEAAKMPTPLYLAGPEKEKSGEKEKSSGMGSFSSSNAREFESGRVMKPFGPYADHLLRDKGYSVFANLLDGQFLIPNTARLTIFAPNDEAIRDANENNLSSMFKRHVVQQRFLWEEVAALVDVALETFHASVIDVDELLSGDLVAEPNLFQNDWLVIHGIKSVLPFPKKLQVIDLFEDANAGASGN